MAEETDQKKAPESPAAPAAETVELLAVPDVTVTEKVTVENNPPPVPEPEPDSAEKAEPVEKSEKVKPEEKIAESASFKEETNVVGKLPDPQKKALNDLKLLLQEALNNRQFTSPPPPVKEAVADEEPPKPVDKTEEPPKPVDKTEDLTPPAVVTETVVTETSEKVTVAVVEDDGVKTVEAIEETVVSVITTAAAAAEAEPKTEEVKTEQTPVLPPPPPEEVSIWGIPLLADSRSDVILLKFLRARDFKVKEAFAMLKNTVKWRKEFGIESLLEETELGAGLEKSVFLHGFDKEGHPVYYNAYGEFQNKELYQNTFSDEEKRQKFLRWRIQFLEKSISKLDFSPDGINTFVFVNDLKNSPGLLKRELRLATNKALLLLQDNYPEFVAKQIVINVPWWYLFWHRLSSPFFSQRTKSKFVFAGPSKTAETLFKYISPEQVPARYGGLSREGEFSAGDETKEEIIKAGSKHTIEIPVTDLGIFVWESRVVGWDVSYGAEFVPDAENGYTVIVQKLIKVGPPAAAEEEDGGVSGTYKVGEAGKIVLTFDNQSSKRKKKVVYRYKTKSE